MSEQPHRRLLGTDKLKVRQRALWSGAGMSVDEDRKQLALSRRRKGFSPSETLGARTRKNRRAGSARRKKILPSCVSAPRGFIDLPIQMVRAVVGQQTRDGKQDRHAPSTSAAVELHLLYRLPIHLPVRLHLYKTEGITDGATGTAATA